MTASHAQRLAALRGQLAGFGLDGFIVPLTDEHMSEYVGGYARRLEWLTGFDGSAGSAAVLPDSAAIFVDGRYTGQVRQQVDGALFDYREAPRETPAGWIAAHAAEGARIGYDPWLATRGFVAAAEAQFAPRGIVLVPVESNPIDRQWRDRPEPSTAPAEVLPEHFSGRSSADKRAAAAAATRAAGADHLLISALDSIAWLLNIRGRDVPRTPVLRAFLLLRNDGHATLFIDPVKITPEVAAHLGPEVIVRPYGDFRRFIGAVGGTVMLDPAWAVAAIFHALEAAGTRIIEAPDPCIAPKAAKNAVEQQGMRDAHLRDGLAVTRFLHSIDANRPADELEAAARLEALRRESNLFRDLSFDSISAFGPNAAFPHYRSTPESNAAFTDGNLYLIDSGAQYPDGTTDITRTIAIGTPTADMRDRFTRVLKGHIALATARFPRGTRGGQLDILARQYLWAAGLDYAHGTGHGVGHYLGVHEGPQRIAAAIGAPGVEVPLQPGMVISNEPGYYQIGSYGIRIENLVLVVEDPQPGDVEPMLAFETLTLAPIDLALVEPALLRHDEIAWLDAYHACVRTAHETNLDGPARDWLIQATRPLAEAISRAA